jgi:hypothetical protein
MAHPLAVRLFPEDGAPPLAVERVRRTDLADARSEAWRDGCLRKGHPDVPLDAIPMRLSLAFAEDAATRCTGYRLEFELPSGKVQSRVFSAKSLRHVAERASQSLVEAGRLKAGQCFRYELTVDPSEATTGIVATDGVAVNLAPRRAALAYLRVSLRSLLGRATPVALAGADDYPVFFTAAAFARAAACARRGAQADPPVETGGALFGSLGACPDTGELCAIVTDVREVQNAEESTFSLSYTGQSWMQLQAIRKARQAACPARADRLLGQCHGHSFRPNDGKVCAACDTRATCTLTSVFVSADDRAWHRAVFARQPWALCHIFGLSARGDPVHSLFGVKDGHLQPRGFYLVPDFPCA